MVAVFLSACNKRFYSCAEQQHSRGGGSNIASQISHSVAPVRAVVICENDASGATERKSITIVCRYIFVTLDAVK